MSKIITVYFSHSGNTRKIAGQIQRIAGGDIFELKSVEPYPNDYNAVVKKARQELDSDYKPPLKGSPGNIGSYDVIFIGYPVWWGTTPMPVFTFLSEYDFSGKTIAPFCTHEGSRLGRSVTDIARLCPRSKVLNGLAVRGSSVNNSLNEVSAWLNEIGMME